MNALTAAPPRPQTPPERTRPHAIVIGSGFGGLAAAIRLGARGYRVTVLERLEQLGGRAACSGRTGSRSMPARRSSPRRSCSKNFGRCAGAACRTMSNCGRWTRSTASASTTARSSTTAATPQAMRAEVARFAPGDVDGYARFMAASEEIYRVGFEQTRRRAVPASGPAWRASRPDLVRLGAWRSVYQMVASYVSDERLRVVLSFHPLLVGGNPFSASAIYSLIAFLERRWGVHFAMGGTGRLVQGLAGLIRGQGGTIRCGAEVAEILVEGGAAAGVRLASRRDHPGRPRRVQRRCGVDLSKTDRAAAPQALDRQADRARAPLDEPVRLVFRHQPPLRGRGAPHDPAGAALSRAAGRHLRHHKLAEDFSLYLHRPTATDPSLAPPGCDAFYVLSPVPHLAGSHRLGGGSRAIPAGDRGRAGADDPAGAWAGGGDLANDDAAGFSGPAALASGRRFRHGAAADAERLVPAAQCQRGRGRAVSRRRRDASRGRAARACCARRRCWTGWWRMSETFDADLAGLPGDAARRLAQLLRRREAAAGAACVGRRRRCMRSAGSPTI